MKDLWTTSKTLEQPLGNMKIVEIAIRDISQLQLLLDTFLAEETF